MALGQNTFWLVVDVIKGCALCPANDQRAAIRFTRESAAQNWADAENAKGTYGAFHYIVVKVPA